jgi:stage V sporulation protein R
MRDTTISPELLAWQAKIEEQARNFGLDFFDTRFEMLDYRTMNQVAAYDGFPVRYRHWRFGMEYERLSKSYNYGLHRIYEMVINTNPCYAYLLASNNLVDQKLVMAHVYGHCDFFKSNLWFAHTNRRMLDEMANHAARVHRHIARHGREQVEDFLDFCLSVDNLIDPHAMGIRRRPIYEPEDGPSVPNGGGSQDAVGKLPAKDYMDSYLNPPEFLATQQQRMEAARKQRERLPPEPEQDVLFFLLEHAPLENWQLDLLDMVREEAYYFVPQRQTKIMNEGWASFVHSNLMTQSGIMTANEVIDYADHHSGTVAVQPGRLNPYKLGLELFRDIEDRWNRGAFGPEYENCQSMEARQNWDRQLGLGREKLFEVRRVYNDIGFIGEFLTEEFVRNNRLFTFDYNRQTSQSEIASREFTAIKQRLLLQLTNFGQPIVEVADANYKNRGELFLVHCHEGIDLDIPLARDTLRALHALWKRPVHIETVVKDERLLYSHDREDGQMQ